MNELIKTFILGVQEVPMLLEQEFQEVLVEPEIGYYRHYDLEPFLRYSNHLGNPLTYWLQENGGLDRVLVNNLAGAKGVVYNQEGEFQIRLYRAGDLQLTPQLPAVGHRIVAEYFNSFIEMSRIWLPYSEDRILGTGNLYHRFHKFIKPELMETYDRTRMAENPEHLSEITMEYLNGRMIVPAQDHIFGVFLDRMIRLCSTIIEPLAAYIVSNPWKQFELQRMHGGDYIVIDRGDFRVNQWEAEHLTKGKL